MTRYRARWVLPIADSPIENGEVGAANGRITYVGARRDDGHDEDVIDFGNAILMPGLVNTHCHLELTAMRGFLENLDFRRWILRLTSAKRSVLDRETLLDAARLGLEEGIAAGITTYGDTCDSGVVLQAMNEYGVRGIMYQELFGPDPAQCESSIADFITKLAAHRLNETELARVGISPHAPYTVSDDLFRASAELARAERLPMAIHVAESDPEFSLVVDGAGTFADGLRGRGIDVASRGATPIRLLESLGVLELHPLLIHCIRVDADDIDVMARRHVHVAHCPISNAKLGHGIAPLLEMLAAGIDVGLGSDSMAANNRMDLLEEARAALLFQRARLRSHELLEAHDVLELATIGGACALGLANDVGTLEVGKSADLAAFDLGAIGPTVDPEAAAIFALSASRTIFVAVAGQPVFEDGLVRGVHPGLLGRVQASADAMRNWLETGGELQPPPAAGIR
jgi:5-methylthioadenosine/S-adenosylhomocysteine deaminase